MTDTKKVDSIFRARSLGVPSVGIPDQYADGRAAKVWELYMGGRTARTEAYKEWFLRTFTELGVRNVLDAACGTGTDSVMLLEAGFTVTSCDASDKMLKTALEERWRRRKEDAFDKWVLKEANWLSLYEDLSDEDDIQIPQGGFDAVICCGNSFAHLPDFEGTQSGHKLAMTNFYRLLKPGGVLVIDHRNYDGILETGVVPHGPNVYYQGKFIKHITCSNLYVDGKPHMITLDYSMDINCVDLVTLSKLKIDPEERGNSWKFRLSYYPHRLEAFNSLLRGVFGSAAEHRIYADFTPIEEFEGRPTYYMHVIRKALE